MRAAALALALLAAQASAEELMTSAEFRSLTEGWTLHFNDEAGEYYGSEQYFSDGRTVWLRAGGQCEEGIWMEESERICFLYEIGMSCWRLYRNGENSFIAETADGDGGDGSRVSSFRRDRAPIVCPEVPGV